MRALLLLTTLLMGTAAHADRVFVGAITPGANADPAIVAVLDEKLLASLRRQRQHEIVGDRDVQAMMDVEAARQNSCCESGLSCEAELAGALDAPIIVTGQVGQVGNTWVLSLTRLDRTSMTVLARTTREVSGPPEGLLGTMDGQVDELFDVGVDVVPIAAGVGVGVGVVSIGAAVGLGIWSWSIFDDATTRLEATDPDDSAGRKAIRQEAAGLGNGVNIGAIAVGAVGAAAVVVGASLFVLDAIGDAS